MSKTTMTVGFIPVDWNSSSDGSKKIMVGDTDFSKTAEMLYELGEGLWKNITFDTKLPDASSVDELKLSWLQIAKDCDRLSSNHDRIPPTVLENLYAICLEEAEHKDSFLDIAEEGKDFFQNNRKKYNGSFYVHYFSVSDEEEIEAEWVFVIKRR